MDARTREAGRVLLENYYRRQSSPIAFIDESYRGSERPDEFPFYILSATVISSSDLDDVRNAFQVAAAGTYWHTTAAYRDKDLTAIFRMKDAVANTVLGTRIAM